MLRSDPKILILIVSLLVSPTVHGNPNPADEQLTETERQLIERMGENALQALQLIRDIECTFDNKDRQEPAGPILPLDYKPLQCLRGRIYKVSEKIPVVSPMVSRQQFEKTSNGEKINWPLSFFLSVGNSLWNLIKLIIYAPIVITANIIEGITHRTSSWWPAQVALNAAWNIATLPVALFNVIADPIWHAIMPRSKSYATVNLLGNDKSLRLNIGGGFLGYLSKVRGWTVSQGLTFTEDRKSPWSTLGHEYIHTEQFRDSFVADFGLKYIFSKKQRSSIEDTAYDQQYTHVKNLWYVQ